jgi:hypothetical protein
MISTILQFFLDNQYACKPRIGRRKGDVELHQTGLSPAHPNGIIHNQQTLLAGRRHPKIPAHACYEPEAVH